MSNEKILEIIYEAVQQGRADIDYVSTYGEPGYSNPEEDKLIYLGDWNKYPRISNFLENLGNHIQWSDEWIIDYNNDRCFKHSTGSFIISDCDIFLSKKDLEENEDYMPTYLEYIVNNPTKADNFNIDWTKYGFKRVEKLFNNGYYGRVDDPKALYRYYRDKGYDVIFSIDYMHPFEVSFSIYLKEIK